MRKPLQLVICILIPVLVGAVSGYFTAESIPTWYAGLQKPSFNPPNYLFGPVWTTLYIIMGISCYRIISRPPVDRRLMVIYAVQLALNFLWSFIFFYFQALDWALVEILLLWGSILTMIILFYKTDKWAGLMNIPYLLWVSFATVLNYSLWVLN
jgi:tryptophan-rich sensory protein